MKAEVINQTIGDFLNCQQSPRFKVREDSLGFSEMVSSTYPFYTDSIDLLLPAIKKIMASNKKIKLVTFFITFGSENKTEEKMKFELAEKVASIIIQTDNDGNKQIK